VKQLKKIEAQAIPYRDHRQVMAPVLRAMSLKWPSGAVPYKPFSPAQLVSEVARLIPSRG